MKKGLDLLEQIKYEIKHNLDYTNQSVKVPVATLEKLIDMAHSNQYSLDLDTARKLAEQASRIKELEKANKELHNLTKALLKNQ